MILIYRLLGIIIFAVMAALTAGGNGASAQGSQMEVIQQGTADLSAYDSPIQSVSLDGEWEFYSDVLLTPEQIALYAEKRTYVPLLHDQANRSQVVGDFGTYRLRMRLPADDVGRQKALYISELASAYTVWVNHKNYGGVGEVGATASEEVPKSRAKMINFEASSAELDIIIQMSSFMSRNEGTFQFIKFGDAETLIAEKMKDKLVSMLTIGGLVVIGLYHLIVYGIRRDDRSVLFIALLALDIAARGWIKDTYLVDLITPNMSWETIVKIDYLTGYIAYLLLVFLMNAMFPMKINRKILWLSHTLTVLFCLYILIAPANMYTATLSAQFTIMLVISLYTIAYVCVLAAKHKREGAILNIVGYTVIAVACINDVLLYQRVIETIEVLYEAIFVFILLQAVLVSYRYSRLMRHNVALSADLLHLNQTLEDKVENRTADLHRKHEELARMHQSRTEMLANISHDMGSPLTGIQMNMQLMKEGLVSGKQQPEFVQSILDKAAYVKRLNDDLFELSLLESGQLSFQFTWVLVHHYLEDYIRKLKADLASGPFQLRVDELETAIDGQEVWMHADLLRISQALNNYAGNAIKFSGGHSSSIAFSCRIVQGAGGAAVAQEAATEAIATETVATEAASTEVSYAIVIEVQDYGTGIPEEELPYVFERFYRRNEGNASGSGLGLAIVKEIVERHQGQAGVVSNAEEGARFYFSLPVYTKKEQI